MRTSLPVIRIPGARCVAGDAFDLNLANLRVSASFEVVSATLGVDVVDLPSVAFEELLDVGHRHPLRLGVFCELGRGCWKHAEAPDELRRRELDLGELLELLKSPSGLLLESLAECDALVPIVDRIREREWQVREVLARLCEPFAADLAMLRERRLGDLTGGALGGLEASGMRRGPVYAGRERGWRGFPSAPGERCHRRPP